MSNKMSNLHDYESSDEGGKEEFSTSTPDKRPVDLILASEGKNVIAVSAFREKEKIDMQQLNLKFANYIEKLRYMDAQRRILTANLGELKIIVSKNKSEIENIYRTELQEAQKHVHVSMEEIEALQRDFHDQKTKFENEQQNYKEAKEWRDRDRETISKENQILLNERVRNWSLKQKRDSLETDRQRDLAIIARLQEEWERLTIVNNNEVIARFDAVNKFQTLSEEMEFVKNFQKKELEGLSTLSYKHITANNRQFWKNELAIALRDIQQSHEQKVDRIRSEMEIFYKLKLQEFCSGATKQNMETTQALEKTKRLQEQLSETKRQIEKERSRHAKLEKQFQCRLDEFGQNESEIEIECKNLQTEMIEIQKESSVKTSQVMTLTNEKLSLENEIAAYRRLLDGEEHRIGLRQIVDQTFGVSVNSSFHMMDIVDNTEGKSYVNRSFHMMDIVDNTDGQSNDQESYESTREEDITEGDSILSVSSKTTFRRTTKGTILIAMADPDGKYIVLENNSSGVNRKEVNLNGWKIHRVVDKNLSRYYEYTFRDFILRPGTSVKIFANAEAKQAGPNDLVFRNSETWGTGLEVVTILLNENGEEKAKLDQRTVF